MLWHYYDNDIMHIDNTVSERIFMSAIGTSVRVTKSRLGRGWGREAEKRGGGEVMTRHRALETAVTYLSMIQTTKLSPFRLISTHRKNTLFFCISSHSATYIKTNDICPSSTSLHVILILTPAFCISLILLRVLFENNESSTHDGLTPLFPSGCVSEILALLLSLLFVVNRLQANRACRSSACAPIERVRYKRASGSLKI